MITRVIENQIEKLLFKGKAILLIGPRQSSKTTLINKILNNYKARTLLLDGDDPNVEHIYSKLTITHFSELML